MMEEVTGRFIRAQDEGGAYMRALREMRQGRKETEWPPFLFPVPEGTGLRLPHSVSGLFGARRYMEDPVLGCRLHELTEAVLCNEGEDIRDIFSGNGAVVMAFRSSMTLFDAVSPGDVFARALAAFFGGCGDPWTLELISKDKDFYGADSALRRHKVGGYDDRGFFEDGVWEAEQIPREARMPTLLDLVLKGESMTGMVRHYIYWKDFSGYRLSAVASCIRHHSLSLRQAVTAALSEQGRKELAGAVARTFDGSVLDACDTSPLSAAEMFDRMVATFRSEPEAGRVLDRIAGDSLLNKEKYPPRKGIRGGGVYC